MWYVGGWVLVSAILLQGLQQVSASGSCKVADLCCPGRDSSCVLQKSPSYEGVGPPHVLNDKPCYCDHACLKLGDCCQDFKDSCGVVDCVVGEWSSWSICGEVCTRSSRVRPVMLHNGNGGHHCPNLIQSRSCNCEPHRRRRTYRDVAYVIPGGPQENFRRNKTSSGIRSCDVMEILSVKPACSKLEGFTGISTGDRVCVFCQGRRCKSPAMHWRSLQESHCHGRWTSLTPHLTIPQQQCYCSINNTFTVM